MRRLSPALAFVVAACGGGDGGARNDAQMASGDAGLGSSDAQRAADAGPTPTIDMQLCDAINQRRADAGLGPVALSSSVMLVARLHVEDLVANGTGGSNCNLHSWSSGDPRWSGCCYTADHSQAQCMWNKPAEIDNHASFGYEIAAGGGGTAITPAQALGIWEGSQAHRSVILNAGIWAGRTWRSLGCGIEGRYAVVWFTELADP